MSNSTVEASNDWPLFQQNPQHTGYNAGENILQPPLFPTAWSGLALDAALIGYPGPVVSNNTLFVKSLSGTLNFHGLTPRGIN